MAFAEREAVKRKVLVARECKEKQLKPKQMLSKRLKPLDPLKWHHQIYDLEPLKHSVDYQKAKVFPQKDQARPKH